MTIYISTYRNCFQCCWWDARSPWNTCSAQQNLQYSCTISVFILRNHIVEALLVDQWTPGNYIIDHSPKFEEPLTSKPIYCRGCISCKLFGACFCFIFRFLRFFYAIYFNGLNLPMYLVLKLMIRLLLETSVHHTDICKMYDLCLILVNSLQILWFTLGANI